MTPMSISQQHNRESKVIALTELLERKYPTGAYLVRSDMTYQAVKQIVEQAGFNFLYIDGQKINTVEEFFAESSNHWC